MSYTIVIDHRETKIKEYFSNLPHPYSITYENLDIGDFVFKKGDDTVLIIERKTINDLYSSIKDGRYKEQKSRLISNFDKSKIIYLIENSIIEQKNKYNTDIVYGSLINMTIRDDIKIIRSESIKETIKFLDILFKRLHTSPEMFTPNIISKNYTDYVNTIKLNKKQNMTPENCQIVQLAQIPGVSVNTAKIIISHFNIKNLILEYEKLEDQKSKELLLENIILTNSSKKRKLGKVLSKRIYEYLN